MIDSPFNPVFDATPAPSPASVSAARCPFHDGAPTLDALLAELDPNDMDLFDAALDLRSLATAGADAEACVEQLLRVRNLLEGRHYLAFYRVRCWARRALRIEVRASRAEAWFASEFPLDGGCYDEICNSALAALTTFGGYNEIPASAHVRFAFS